MVQYHYEERRNPVCCSARVRDAFGFHYKNILPGLAKYWNTIMALYEFLYDEYLLVMHIQQLFRTNYKQPLNS